MSFFYIIAIWACEWDIFYTVLIVGLWLSFLYYHVIVGPTSLHGIIVTVGL